MKRVVPWLITLALLAGAWVLNAIQLPENAASAPFVTTGEAGEETAARNLVVTVVDVRGAQRITDSAGWSADGTWLVIDLDAASAATQNTLLGNARLQLGERVYSATERAASLYRAQLIPGVAKHGSLAFELPDGALEGSATLTLGTAPAGVEMLDGVVEIPLDLDDVSIDEEVALAATDWAAS